MIDISIKHAEEVASERVHGFTVEPRIIGQEPSRGLTVNKYFRTKLTEPLNL